MPAPATSHAAIRSGPRSAWVVGASSGIGRDVALCLAAEGFRVFASARRMSALRALADSFGAMQRVTPVEADVTDAESVAAALAAVEHTAPVDLCVIAAGTHTPMTLPQFTLDAVSQLVDVNLMGAVRVLAAVLPGMLARRRGHIVVIASVAGYRGLPTAAAYGASKAALIHLCESLHLDLRGTGVRIQLVNPGFVRTPLTDRNTFPMPFRMESADAARRIVHGLRSRRFEITFPRRFTWILKLLRVLPYAVYFPLVGRLRNPGRVE